MICCDRVGDRDRHVDITIVLYIRNVMYRLAGPNKARLDQLRSSPKFTAKVAFYMQMLELVCYNYTLYHTL